MAQYLNQSFSPGTSLLEAHENGVVNHDLQIYARAELTSRYSNPNWILVINDEVNKNVNIAKDMQTKLIHLWEGFDKYHNKW